MRHPAGTRQPRELGAQAAHVVAEAHRRALGVEPPLQPRRVRRDAGRAAAGVAALAWMHPTASIASRPTLTMSAPIANASSALAGRPSLPEPEEHHPVGDAGAGEDPVDAGEADAQRQRDVVGEHQRPRARASLAAVDRDEVGPAAARSIRWASVCQKPISPTADLMPTGRPVAAATRSMNSTRPATPSNAECDGGLSQSRPAGPRGPRRSPP